jgi:hypothetical protein
MEEQTYTRCQNCNALKNVKIMVTVPIDANSGVEVCPRCAEAITLWEVLKDNLKSAE